MTKQQIPMRGALEYDALTKWRHYVNWKAGARKALKRQYNRRARKVAKREVVRVDKWT